MCKRLLKIDDLLREQHHYLTSEDDCFYLREYTPRKGYAHSPTNNLISNLKKCPSKKGTSEYAHKNKAIKSVAENFKKVLSSEILKAWTLVPIPPSKMRSDPLYDDRMTQIMHFMTEGLNSDIREILKAKISTEASHASNIRLSPGQLEEILTVDESQTAPPPKGIILFDDVLTAGAHFRACKNLLSARFPGIPIIGIFIARRELDNIANDFEEI